jgi:hypothetical protein
MMKDARRHGDSSKAIYVTPVAWLLAFVERCLHARPSLQYSQFLVRSLGVKLRMQIE